MRKKIIVLLCLTLVMATAAWAQQATIRSVSGKVEVQTAGGAWQPATVGMVVPVGATISTGFGASANVEIQTATIVVGALTRVRLDELAQREGVQTTDLTLRVGRVRAEVRSAEGLQSEFRLRSTQSTASVRGTSFEFDGRNLRVLSGLVQLANLNQQSSNVGAGESGEVDENGEVNSGSDQRERNSSVQVAVTDFGDGAPTFLPRRDELGVGSIRVRWTLADPTPQ